MKTQLGARRAARILALVFLLAMGACRRAANDPETAGDTVTQGLVRPHVVFISVDTLRADHLGAYGYGRETSPRIDELARSSVRFDQASSQASWTLPSHMSMITSQYPHVHGVEDDGTSLAEEATTLAEILAANGYDTAALISWVYLSEQYGFAQGFGRFEELLPPPHLVDSATRASFKAEHVTDYAIRWLERPHERPYFLFVHYFDPHLDYAPPEPYDTMFDPDYKGDARGDFEWIWPYIKGVHHEPATITPRDLEHITALYDGEIRYTDVHVGRLLDAVDRTLGLDNCIIVFTSDHGEELNDHGSMEGHQWTLYEEVIRVPLLIRLPNRALAGRVIRAPVELIDIAPTLLARLGIARPGTFQGKDLFTIMNNPTDGTSDWLAYGEIQRYNNKQFIRNQRFKLIFTEDIGLNKRGIPVEPGFEFFDLVEDPHEQTNGFDEGAAIANHLMIELERHRQLSLDSAAPAKAKDIELSEGDRKRLESLGYVGEP